MLGGYHTDTLKESMVDCARWAAEGLEDLVDGCEYHCPNELNEKIVEEVRSVLGNKDIYALALGTFSDPRCRFGAFINPDPELREEGPRDDQTRY